MCWNAGFFYKNQRIATKRYNHEDGLAALRDARENIAPQIAKAVSEVIRDAINPRAKDIPVGTIEIKMREDSDQIELMPCECKRLGIDGRLHPPLAWELEQ